jgi:hypothetical protein
MRPQGYIRLNNKSFLDCQSAALAAASNRFSDHIFFICLYLRLLLTTVFYPRIALYGESSDS